MVRRFLAPPVHKALIRGRGTRRVRRAVHRTPRSSAHHRETAGLALDEHDQTARLSRAEIEERKNSSPIVVGAEDDKPSTGGDAVTFGGDRVNISAGARFDRSRTARARDDLMTLMRTGLLAVLLSASSLAPALAQQGQSGSMSDMKGMDMKGADMKSMNPMQKESMAAMDKMNKAMMEGMMDGDPDVAWLKSMAAHHQGAVDMSEIALKHIKDESVRKEARKAMEENEKSIKEVKMLIKKEK